jgi:UDP-N-acetylmuramate dehydrogenase
MQLQQNISLLPYNTFGIDVRAAYFAQVAHLPDLEEIAGLPHPVHVLGGGSNILLTAPVQGLVLHNGLKGISLIREDDNHVWLEVQAGEAWHSLVLHTINKGWGGLENLALIPGTVGASPLQNIGAYGAEAKDTIVQVTFRHLQEKTMHTFSNAECGFGYRDSIFKRELKDMVFITSVVFKLSKHPVLNTGYGAIEQELERMGATELSVNTVAQAVINIRSSKLPDPAVLGNAGSFFKNPSMSRGQYEQLLADFPAMPHYNVSNELVKVPAAWLIEQCGWKGYRKGDAGVHKNQALVLVNYGTATGEELWQLSGEIVASLKEKFNIELEREVQVW